MIFNRASEPFPSPALQLAVTPEVIHYIVRRLERSFAEARRFVTLLDNSALAKKRKITVSLLRDVFREEQE